MRRVLLRCKRVVFLARALQESRILEHGMIAKTIFTCPFGMLGYQLLTRFLEPIEATRRAAGWSS